MILNESQTYLYSVCFTAVVGKLLKWRVIFVFLEDFVTDYIH